MLELGTQTGSLINHMMSMGDSKEPKIGDGATILSWTDRHPATVVSFDKKRSIVGITRDDYRRIDNNGMSECQEYEYTSNPDGPIEYYKKDKNGSWSGVFFNSETKRWNKRGGIIIIGRRDRYHDFSF